MGSKLVLSPEAACTGKIFDTIENTYKKQKDCKKYCFKQKNIAQAVTSSN